MITVIAIAFVLCCGLGCVLVLDSTAQKRVLFVDQDGDKGYPLQKVKYDDSGCCVAMILASSSTEQLQRQHGRG